MIVLGFCIFIFGICFLTAALILAVQNRRRSAETAGTITGVRTRRTGNKGTAYLIDFEYYTDGVRQELKNVRWPLPPDAAGKYTVCFNPGKARDAHVREFRASAKLYLIIGLASLAAALILVVLGAAA